MKGLGDVVGIVWCETSEKLEAHTDIVKGFINEPELDKTMGILHGQKRGGIMSRGWPWVRLNAFLM